LSGSGYGVVGQSGSGTGIAAEATTGNGLYAYATTGSAAFMVSSPPEKASLYVFNDGHADGSSNVPQGIYASASGIGVNAYAPGGIGVFGVAHGQSNLASALLKDHYGAGTWGDTSGDLISQFDLGGVVGTADGNNAGAFYNNSNAYATLYLYNWGPGGTGLFRTLQADTSDGTCGFGGKGDLTCTGQVKTLATTGGARTLETYAMQSPENCVATVAIDPAFAETVNTSTDYYIFLTPNGDSKGLYVTARTASGFEVRESGGGDSSLTFDYRIVAKRRGYESERLTDVTEQFQAQMERASLPRRAAASGRTTQPNIQPSSAPR
jgi:hypothetical protein